MGPLVTQVMNRAERHRFYRFYGIDEKWEKGIYYHALMEILRIAGMFVKLIIGSNAHEGTTFVHPENAGFPNSFDGEPGEVVDSIIHELHGDWIRFTKTGEPNMAWPRYTGYDCEIRIYDRETRTERADRTALMEAWGDMRFYED